MEFRLRMRRGAKYKKLFWKDIFYSYCMRSNKGIMDGLRIQTSENPSEKAEHHF